MNPKGLIMHRYRFALFLCLVWVALPVSSHEGHDDAPGQASGAGTDQSQAIITKESQFLLGVRTTLAKTETVAESLKVNGQIQLNPKGVVAVYAPYPGRITGGLLPVPGQYVRAGQALAVLQEVLSGSDQIQFRNRTIELESALAQSRLLLDLALQDIHLAEEDVALTSQNLERLKKLDRIIAKKDLPVAELELSRANAGLIRAKGELRKQQFQIQQQQTQLTYYRTFQTGSRTGRTYTVQASQSGFVSQAEAFLGQQVDTSQRLYRIVNTSSVWAEALLYEKDIALVPRLKQAEITTGSYPGLSFHGWLATTDQELDPQSHTLKARFMVDNPGYALKPGMFASVTLQTNKKTQAVVVPSEAVYESDNKTWVIVHEQAEVFERREVELGPKQENRRIILRGVEAGERVVTRGAHQLYTVILSPPKK